MRPYSQTFRIELRLFMRNLSGPFFTFVFPSLLLIVFETVLPAFVPLAVLLPHYIGLVIIVPGLLTFPLSIAEYRHHHVYKRLEATNFGMNRVLIIQLMVHLLMTLAGIVLLLLIGTYFFNIQLPPNFFLLALAVLLAISSIFSLGFAIAAFSPSAQLTSSLTMVLYFIMIYLSGAAIPIEQFPDWLQQVSQTLPLTHINLLMLKIWDETTLLKAILPLTWQLLGITALFLIAGLLWKLKKPWY